MKARIGIGPAPWGTNCAQVGQPKYAECAQVECEAFKGQLLRVFESKFGRGPKCTVTVQEIEHDFGRYYEVAVLYDETSEEDAFWFDSNTPEEWDYEALMELSRHPSGAVNHDYLMEQALRRDV